MKAIRITEKNQHELSVKFGVDELDKDDMLPPGYILVADFGVTDHFEVLTPDKFDAVFEENNNDFEEPDAKLKNGFYAVNRQ